MTRRRIFWLISAVVVLIGAAAIAWAVFGNRDADFQAEGPRTRSIRANFAMLDTTIDAADFHDCENLNQVLARLQKKLRKPADEDDDRLVLHWHGPFFRVNSDALAPGEPERNLYDMPVHYPAESNPMTVKQFLRLTFRQVTTQEVGFMVTRHSVEATTMKRLEEERARYAESVPVFDRLKQAWRELMGNVEDDPPETLLLITTAPHQDWVAP